MAHSDTKLKSPITVPSAFDATGLMDVRKGIESFKIKTALNIISQNEFGGLSAPQNNYKKEGNENSRSRSSSSRTCSIAINNVKSQERSTKFFSKYPTESRYYILCANNDVKSNMNIHQQRQQNLQQL